MKKLNLMLLFGIILVFILGGILGAYATIAMQTLKVIDKVEITNNCTDIRRSVYYLELINKKDFENMRENLEWDLDQGVMAVSQYLPNDKSFRQLDEYDMNSLCMAKSHRKQNPRETGIVVTDKIVSSLLSNKAIPDQIRR